MRTHRKTRNDWNYTAGLHIHRKKKREISENETILQRKKETIFMCQWHSPFYKYTRFDQKLKVRARVNHQNIHTKLKHTNTHLFTENDGNARIFIRPHANQIRVWCSRVILEIRQTLNINNYSTEWTSQFMRKAIIWLLISPKTTDEQQKNETL